MGELVLVPGEEGGSSSRANTMSNVRSASAASARPDADDMSCRSVVRMKWNASKRDTFVVTQMGSHSSGSLDSALRRTDRPP